ncbi:type II toxin-antitoxin system PemK/MazF family toxin [Candidatus Halobeggiatoa sp. HSG11]|nr:type II toxin-antitoxin system PemK/MazF family toxin [Candidatus Halobeggiatoa sp. HSG11]
MNNFDNWNEVKKRTDKNKNIVGFKERDIFWLRLGKNIGNEQYGKGNEFQRPVLIIKKLTPCMFVGVPLTSKLKGDNKYFHEFEYTTKKGLLINNSALILQLKAFDKKRLMGRIGMIDKDEFTKILEKIRNLFIPPK